MKLHFAWVVVLSYYAGIVYAQLKCKDGAKQDIDWGVFYVLPGEQKAYAVSNTAADNWANDKANLTLDDGVLGGLLKPFYDAKDTYNIIAYNDFPPNFRQPSKCSSPAKGLLGYTDNNGWWLTHSIDKWPDMTGTKYEPPPAGGAGLIVCISLPIASMEQWALAINYQDPVVYYFNSVANAATSIANRKELNALTIPAQPVYTPYVKMVIIENIGGAKVHLFGMLPQGNQDIYSSYMAPVMKQSLIAWTKPTATEQLIASKCSTVYKVENVKPDSTITVKDVQIKRDQDTARWVISKKKGANAVKSSLEKGAGAACIEQQKLHELFFAIAPAKLLEACSTSG
ncbi:hypothetical protein M514_04629 [Trichuris suis]|uniref:Uncharacterized protein n=1 Tax=Trichuris suis TaxID=68888 RepID=A0A085NV51_9BILA|nr:hypothetical protein M514_04629 [Trichuris suis]